MQLYDIMLRQESVMSQGKRYHGALRWRGKGGVMGLLLMSGGTSIVCGKFKYAFTLKSCSC